MRLSIAAALIVSPLFAVHASGRPKADLAATRPRKVEAGIAIRASKLPVKETIDAIAKAAEDKGAKIVARVDHAGGAKAVGDRDGRRARLSL